MADAHGRERAVTMLQFMVAAQGDGESWKRQQRELLKLLE